MGLGHNRADEFTNHWWERVYNEASENVVVKPGGSGSAGGLSNEDDISMTVKDVNSVEVNDNFT